MRQAVRQTRTHIGELLARHGINPRHELGQNFLIDLNLIEYLIAQAELDLDDLVLEVGSGTGGLTAFLAEKAGAVIAVEVDARMRQLTAEAVDGFTNVTLLGCDVLKNKNHFAQPVLDAIDAALEQASKPAERNAGRAALETETSEPEVSQEPTSPEQGSFPASNSIFFGPPHRLKLVANLPYCVATPVISNLVASDYVWDRMVVTIQLELAERMTAKAGASSYGALSVWLQSQCRIELLKRLPASVFWPRPKVESAMIRIVPDAERRRTIRDRGFLHDFLRGIFQQRRKLLRNVLIAHYRQELDRPRIDSVLQSQGLGERTRAEDLAPTVLVSLCNALYETVQKTRGQESPSA